MDALYGFVQTLNGIVWGPPMIILILGTGLFLQLRLRFMPLRKIFSALGMILQSRKSGTKEDGEISPFAALMTALSATVGTGNIVGVATAIAAGGPGALFWMWMTALVGIATKYAEVVLAVHYRDVDGNGEHAGGPMYVIKNALGSNWKWLATAFAVFGGMAGFGIGNMVQSNGIASAVHNAFAVPNWITGATLVVLTGLVVLGGIKRIGAVAEFLVPTMCIGYVLCTMYVLISFSSKLPDAISLIFSSAFSPTAAIGGFLGSTIMITIQKGVARGIFSNEAGLGTAGIAQAAGQTKDPVFSGLIGMTGTFIDTLIVGSMTGLAIVATGSWTSGNDGALVSAATFEAAMPGWGNAFLALSLSVFAFTTILGWAYYGEKCWEYLLGTVSEKPFRILWTLSVFPGAVVSLDFAWLIADTLNALMAIPNLVSLLILSPQLVQLTRTYFDANEQGVAA